MKVFSAIVILSVLCITSKAQHFCESLIQNNYETMFYFHNYPFGIFVIGDKYYGLELSGDLYLKPDQPLPQNGSIGLLKEYSIILHSDWRYPDAFYNPTNKSIDYIKYNVNTGVFDIKRNDVMIKGRTDLLENSTFAFRRTMPHFDHILVTQKPSSNGDSIESTYLSVEAIPTDSNTTLTINYKSDESQNYDQIFENYSTDGYRLMGTAQHNMIHQKKGSFVYCILYQCNNGSIKPKELIDCDSLGFTVMTTITTEADTASNGNTPGIDSPQVSTELGSDSETGDLRTSTYEPQTQSKDEGDGTRTPDQSNISPGSSISFGLDLWLILLIIFIIVAVVAVLIVLIVWFRSRSSQQKSEDGPKADAPKSQSSPKSSADAKNESEELSVRSE